MNVSIHDRQGYLFTAKNGSRLFFPANGYAYDQNVDTPDEGYYWTSTFSNIDNAYVTYLPSNSWGISYYDRYIGIGIRAVKLNCNQYSNEKTIRITFRSNYQNVFRCIR